MNGWQVVAFAVALTLLVGIIAAAISSSEPVPSPMTIEDHSEPVEFDGETGP